MQAMCLEKLGEPLVLKTIAEPVLGAEEVLVQVRACGVCRTDLHILEGDLEVPKLPLILGHQVVGIVVEIGSKVKNAVKGQRVGVPWLGKTCNHCPYCLSARENLCDFAEFTGYSINGGYAELCKAHQDYILPIPEQYSDVEAAPLLCAGLIGYRAFRMAGDVKTLGFYGFGSSAHLLIQVANALGKDVFVFTRTKDKKTAEFARSLGARWAGGSNELPPEPLDAALIFAPVGALYPQALKAVKKGGRVISAGIHMSNIPAFPYSLLWEERIMTSVANLTRQDGQMFMDLARQIPIKVAAHAFPLAQANEALQSIRKGKVQGSCVLVM